MVRQCRIEPPREAEPADPGALDTVVMKALAREPDERYQDAGEMHRALERVLRERQPPSASELSRFMEVLFDRDEREEAIPDDHPSGEHKTRLRRAHAGTRDAADGESPDSSADPMSVDELLKRFGIKWTALPPDSGR